MSNNLETLRATIQSAGQFAVYCAGEFASLFIQYCSSKGFAKKIVSCIVTKREGYTPAHILGVPVIELDVFEQPKDMLIVVTILSPRGKQEIEHVLRTKGYTNLYFLEENVFRDLNEHLADFTADIRCMLERQFAQNFAQNQQQMIESQRQYESLSTLIQSMPLVVETHKQSFGKYKDIYRGKTIVVCAPGPSLNQYAFDDRYIHIGVNSLLFHDKVKLDYYFNQHIPSEYDFWGNGVDVHPIRRKKYLESFPKLKCVKFIGQMVGDGWNISPPFGEVSNAEYGTYYISDRETTHHFCPDIRYGFLYGARSVIFPALQFALFTNPQRILLVGADGYSAASVNYFSEESDAYLKEAFATNRSEILNDITEGIGDIYKEFKKFAAIRYPNTEIIMVNSVHYKGIFRDTTTDDEGRVLL